MVQKYADTIVLGAGISGLSIAHAAHSHDHAVLLLESSDQVGGSIQSYRADGYLAEHGPNSILIKDKQVATLLTEVGLDAQESQRANNKAKKRYIVHQGQLHAMPSSPLTMIKTPLFSLGGKLRFAMEPFIGRYAEHKNGHNEESFADFVRRRLGADMLTSAAGPFVSGIYAGDPEKLSVRHAFPRLWSLEDRYRSCILGAIALKLGAGGNSDQLAKGKMLSFRSGMHAIPKAIHDHLPHNSVKTQCAITKIKKTNAGWSVCWNDISGQQETTCKNLVITAPHHKLRDLPLPNSVFNGLTPVMSLDSPPVTSLVLGFKKEDITHPLDGFGMLIKQSENSRLLGVLFSSSMFDGRAPEGHVTLTCMMGGTIHPEYSENSDEIVLAELDRLLGVSGKPTFRHKISWPRAIPQYGLDYQNTLDAMDEVENNNPGLHFAGNYRGGISVGDCIVNGLELGTRLSTNEQQGF
ncbi:MAG: protoporphyrinogen oxidase [Akkermansiaceae bacterium]|nr:protoporphyrinogen oxidase [Akkermansiaceae bacterium]